MIDRLTNLLRHDHQSV